MVQEGTGRKKTTQWVQINLLVLPTTQAGGQVVCSGVEGGTLAGAFFFMQTHSPSSFPCFPCLGLLLLVQSKQLGCKLAVQGLGDLVAHR